MMADNYFIVLQLPGGSKRKYTEGKSCPNGFWNHAAAAVNAGKAKIISARPDTGAAEEIRWHVSRLNRFSTFILVNMRLRKHDTKTSILKKAGKALSTPNKTANIVDASDKFQLIAT